MRGALLASLVLLAGVAGGPWVTGAVQAASARKGAPTKIKWAKSVKEARALAQKTGKPLLMEFYADWCGPCKDMEQTTLRHPDVVAASDRYVAVRVNIDVEKQLAAYLKVTSIPQAFVATPRGNVVLGATGYLNAAEFQSFLKEGLKRVKQ